MRFLGVRRAWRAVRRPRVFDTTLVGFLEIFGVSMTIAAFAQANHRAGVVGTIFVLTAAFLLVRRRRPVMVAAAAIVPDLLSAFFIMPTAAVATPPSIALYRVRRQCSGLQAGGEADRPA